MQTIYDAKKLNFVLTKNGKIYFKCVRLYQIC